MSSGNQLGTSGTRRAERTQESEETSNASNNNNSLIEEQIEWKSNYSDASNSDLTKEQSELNQNNWSNSIQCNNAF